MLIEVKSDVYDVVKRIKKIDKNYQLFFNTKKEVYELHNKDQLFSTYCLTFPFKYIDARMIDYTLKTRAQNKDKIFKEIEEENQKLLKSEINRSKDKIIKGEF